MTACPFQPPGGLLGIAVCQQYGDGSLYAAARCINGGAGFFPLHALSLIHISEQDLLLCPAQLFAHQHMGIAQPGSSQPAAEGGDVYKRQSFTSTSLAPGKSTSAVCRVRQSGVI